MSTGCRSLRVRRAGFSLFEVVVAAALLLLTISVVTAAVVNASAAGSRLGRSMAVDRALAREVERLRALPYCAPAYPALTEQQYAAGGEAGDVVGAVFPHAVTARNAESARFVTAETAGDAPAGSFVTVREIDGGTVTMVARFVGWGDVEPLDADAVAGWAAWRAAPPPAGAVDVHLRVTREDVQRECRVELASLPPGRASGEVDGGGT